MRKRTLFIILMVALLACAFALSVSAKDITVGSSDCDYTSINSATSAAADGDTIIIKTDITGGTINFNKSLTYILEANWTNIAGNAASASTANKSISVYARGGNRTMAFKGDTLFNSYNSANTEGMTISFGGENDYTLTLNVSGVTRRFMYGFSGATVNFYKGTVFTGSQKSSNTGWQGGDTNLDCGTFNLYEGAQIYGNREIGSSTLGFISASQEINIYGGKIYGNIISSSGYAFIRCTGNFNMYAGEIYNNYCLYASTGGDHGPGLINAVEQNIYGGKIYNNYMKKGNSVYGGTVFGSRIYTNKGDSSTPCHAYLVDNTVYNNYSFNIVTSITNDNYLTYFSVEENGAYKLKDASFLTTVEFHRSYNETLYAYSVIFSDTNSKIINAYMVNSDGTVLKSVDGSGVITIPSDVTAWSAKANNCKPVAVETDKQGTYYAADNHTVSDDFNCETALICTACEETIVKAMQHSLITTIDYTSGYTSAGVKDVICENIGCIVCNKTGEAPQIFTCLGYSAPEDGRGGIAIGYTVNNEAITEYTKVTGKTLKYGVFAVLRDRLGTNDVFAEDGTPAAGVINAEISNYNFVAFELKITGFTDTQKDTKLAMGAYVAVTDGETTEYSYMQSGTPTENEKYCFVSYNDIVPTTSNEDEG